MKKSVGIVIITHLGNDYLALLQKRASLNKEKGTAESYPGCLQVSCHGKLEEGEYFHQALIRELGEELGERFGSELCQSIICQDIPFQKIVDVEDEEKHVITFAAFVSGERLKMMELGEDVGSLVYIPEDEVDQIIPITRVMKTEGPPPGMMAMFPDEIDAVKKAFEIVRIVKS